jgi:drug/metabolite transporter (DMT)-like permease
VRRAALLALLAFAAPMLLGIEGVRRAGAANASILILLEPATIVAIAWLVMGEHIGAAKLAGLVAGLGGALVIVLEGASLADLVSGEHVVGNTMLAVHGVLWGLYTPLAKPLSERHDPIAICLVATAFSMLLFVPAALVEAPQWRTSAELAPALAWCAGLGLVVSFLATVLWLTALKQLAGTSVAAFVFLQPFAGVLTAVMFQGERLTRAGIVGGGLIALGVALDLFPKPGARIQAPLP